MALVLPADRTGVLPCQYLERAITARVVDRFPIGTPFPIHREMQSITMDVMLRAVFGVDQEAVFTAMKEKVERFVGQANGPSAPFIALSAFQVDLGRFSPWGRFVRNRAVSVARRGRPAAPTSSRCWSTRATSRASR